MTAPIDIPIEPTNVVRVYAPLAAKTASVNYNDSGNSAIQIAGAESVIVSLTGSADLANRTGTLTVYVSVDGGASYSAYNKLIGNVSNTNGNNDTIHSTTLVQNAVGVIFAWMDPILLGAITHILCDLQIADAGGPAGNIGVEVAAKF